MDKSIDEVIQNEVDKIVKENWKEDTCKPVFIVSIFQDKLMITCKHMGSAFSEKLFPQKDMRWGLPTVKEIMESLYNRTM